jgi:hypothetical protein
MDEKFKSKDLKNFGIEVEIPESYDFIETESLNYIIDSLKNYPKAKECFEVLVNDPELRADWDLANFIAVKKLKYNDHGEVHAKIVCASALKMLDILLENGIKPDFIQPILQFQFLIEFFQNFMMILRIELKLEGLF